MMENNKNIEYIREDLENDMGYTKIIIISQLLMKLKKKGLSKEQIDKEIKEFRLKQMWDKLCPRCNDNASKILHEKKFFCIKCNYIFE